MRRRSLFNLYETKGESLTRIAVARVTSFRLVKILWNRRKIPKTKVYLYIWQLWFSVAVRNPFLNLRDKMEKKFKKLSTFEHSYLLILYIRKVIYCNYHRIPSALRILPLRPCAILHHINRPQHEIDYDRGKEVQLRRGAIKILNT